jgi:hypothetical protein
LRLVAAAAAARRYQVTVTSEGSGFRGELRDVGWPAPRTLEARDCGELVDALALMLALSSAREAAPESEPAHAAPEAPARAAPPVVAAAVPPPPMTEPPRAPRSIPAEARERPPQKVDARPSAALMGALLWFGAVPDPLKGIVIAGEHAFAPTLIGRLEARIAFASQQADATFFGLAPQFCARTGWPELTISGCFGLAAGTLPVKGVEYSGGPQSSGWLAPLLGVKVATSLGEVVQLEAGAEAEHALLTRSYDVKASDDPFETPDFSALIMVAAGAKF